MGIEILRQDRAGAYQTAAILSPFANAIAPALDARTEEILVVLCERNSHATPSRPAEITYVHPGEGRRLIGLPPELPPYIVWSRLRIVAGISIVGRETCRGELFVRIGARIVKVLVMAETGEHEEIFRLRPDWDSINPNDS